MRHRFGHPAASVHPPAKRGQEGFTLLEVIIGMALTVLLVGVLMTPVVLATRHQVSDSNYTWAQQRARTGLNEIVRQVRQSWQILSASPNAVEMNVTQAGVSDEVYYECDVPQPGTQYHECVRVTAPSGSTLPSLSSGTVVITNLLNGTTSSPVFSFAPSPIAPYYMTATVQVPASNGRANGLNHSILFSDGALMRNLNIGN
jgi:type II secretory pathway pseudopilin PulG